MRPILKAILTMAAIAVLVVPAVWASPQVDSAVFNLRVFNDCPSSNLTPTNNFPTSMVIEDTDLSCNGFANLHNWHLAVGGSEAVFNNGDSFTLRLDLRITGNTDGEAGIQVAPWWSQDVDGRFNVRSSDGEIACFGGRLPFYSFTATDGVTYTKGDIIGLTVVYTANDLNEANPATIEYKVDYGGSSYSSGPLPFDMGNPDEDPPHGLWGMLNDARVGGYCQLFLDPGNTDSGVMVEWMNIEYDDFSVATEASSFSRIKSLY